MTPLMTFPVGAAPLLELELAAAALDDADTADEADETSEDAAETTELAAEVSELIAEVTVEARLGMSPTRLKD